MSVALAVITGTVQEKKSAFTEIANTVQSGMLPAGYNSVPKVQAACWMADALQVHPMVFMQGVHAMYVRGQTILEPKWEFVNALLRSRLPGFSFKVEVETPEICTILFRVGDEQHVVTYTMEDAERQGLVRKNPDLYGPNAREALFKQCFKRGADRIGSHVLAGMPAPVPMEEAPRPTNGDAPPEPPSGAEVVDSIAEMLDETRATTVPATQARVEHVVDENPDADLDAMLADDVVPEPDPVDPGAPQPPGDDMLTPYQQLELALRRKYQPMHLTDKLLAEKAQATLELMTGKALPKKLQKLDHVPLQQARELAEWLNKLSAPAPPKPKAPPEEPVKWSEVEAVAAEFFKATGQKLIAPSPNNAAKMYLVHKTVREAVGYEKTTLLAEAGELVDGVTPFILAQIIEQAARVAKMAKNAAPNYAAEVNQ